MRYDENTAGGMMNTELVMVGEDATRGEVIDYIRFNELYPDQLDNIVLINHYGALSGTVPIARLVTANSEQRMDELRFEPIVSVRPDANEAEVFDLFDKYNLRGLTVVDADNRPIGAISVDDVVSRMNAKL
jgi:magnesium transporter